MTHVHAKAAHALTRSSTRGMKLRNATSIPAIPRNSHLYHDVGDDIALALAKGLYIVTPIRRTIRLATGHATDPTIHALPNCSKETVLKKET